MHFLEWKLISLKVSLKFVPKVPVSNIPALVRLGQRQAIIWTNDVYWRIYASLGFNVLEMRFPSSVIGLLRLCREIVLQDVNIGEIPQPILVVYKTHTDCTPHTTISNRWPGVHADVHITHVLQCGFLHNSKGCAIRTKSIPIYS